MNNVNLLGRLVADPDLNFSAGNGTAICRFRLAVSRPYKKDETDFFNCIAFNKKAETIAQYLTKGKQIAIHGHLQSNVYDAKDGTKRYTVDVLVDNFDFIGKSSNNNSDEKVNNNNFEEEIEPVDFDGTPF